MTSFVLFSFCIEGAMLYVNCWFTHWYFKLWNSRVTNCVSQHCEKRLPLKWRKWRNFREGSNFQRIWFRDLRSLFWGPEIKHLWKHTTSLCDKDVFSSIIISQLRRPKWVQLFTGLFVCAYICWDTPSEKTGPWQLPNVFSALNVQCLIS